MGEYKRLNGEGWTMWNHDHLSQKDQKVVLTVFLVYTRSKKEGRKKPADLFSCFGTLPKDLVKLILRDMFDVTSKVKASLINKKIVEFVDFFADESAFFSFLESKSLW